MKKSVILSNLTMKFDRYLVFFFVNFLYQLKKEGIFHDIVYLTHFRHSIHTETNYPQMLKCRPTQLAKWIRQMAILPYLPNKNLCNGHFSHVLNLNFDRHVTRDMACQIDRNGTVIFKKKRKHSNSMWNLIICVCRHCFNFLLCRQVIFFSNFVTIFSHELVFHGFPSTT